MEQDEVGSLIRQAKEHLSNDTCFEPKTCLKIGSHVTAKERLSYKSGDQAELFLKNEEFLKWLMSSISPDKSGFCYAYQSN